MAAYDSDALHPNSAAVTPLRTAWSAKVHPTASLDQPSASINGAAGAVASTHDTHPHDQSALTESSQAASSGLLILTLYAPRWLLSCLWWYILLYQLCNAAMLGGLSYMYLTAPQRDSILWYIRANFLFARAARFLNQVSPYVCGAYLLFAFGFFYGAGGMLWASIAHRRLCYGMTIKKGSKPQPQRKQRGIGVVVQTAQKGFRIWQSFGMRGKYFASGLIVREGVEAALQTIQASSSANQISNPFVNYSYAVLIFINCCSSYLYGFLFRADHVHRRLACVLTDLSLDFVWGTIMPVVVFMPYARLYLSRNEVGATSTVSTESVETEVEQMLVLSLKAFILSIFPFVSASGNIRGIKRLLEQAKSTARPQEENFQPTSEWQSTASQSEGAPHTFQDRLRRNRTVRVIRSYVKVWSLSHLVHALMVLFGVIILGISIASSNFIHRFEATPYDCQRRLRPWLSTKEACAGRVINCTKAGIQGQPAEIMAALEYFDEKTLSSLTFTECSALEFPSTMQRFKNLKALNVYNSAIVGWSEDFALTSSHFPSIQTVRLWYIDLQCSPEGLYRHPLSSSLEWLSLYDIDITGFVDEVGEQWKNLQFAYFDMTRIEDIPQVVTTMPSLLELSLTYNAFTSLNTSRVANLEQLTSLWMDGSSITPLPDEIWRLTHHLQEFAIQYTNVSMYPSWINEIANPELLIEAFGAPLCDDTSPSYAVGKLDHLSCVENLYGYN